MKNNNKEIKFEVDYSVIFEIIRENITFLAFSQKYEISLGEIHILKHNHNVTMNTLLKVLSALIDLTGKDYKLEDIVTIKKKK